MSNYFLFDTETGGIKKETSLLTIFGYILNEDLNVLSEVSYAIKAENGLYIVEADGLTANHIDIVEHDKIATSIAEVKLRFKNDICKWNFAAGKQKITPIGHNVRFDVKFVKNHIMPDWDNYFDRRQIDTAGIAKFLFLTGLLPTMISYQLSDIARSLEINFKEETLHTSKGDVDLTLAIIRKYKQIVRTNTERAEKLYEIYS